MALYLKSIYAPENVLSIYDISEIETMSRISGVEVGKTGDGIELNMTRAKYEEMVRGGYFAGIDVEYYENWR